jgi:hypothetical protein
MMKAIESHLRSTDAIMVDKKSGSVFVTKPDFNYNRW